MARGASDRDQTMMPISTKSMKRNCETRKVIMIPPLCMKTLTSLLSGSLLSRLRRFRDDQRQPLHHGLGPVLHYADIERGGEKVGMIYLIYKDGEILVETDDLEYVKTYMSQNQECSVRDARTGKKIPLE
jgi:hypothetical protein